MTASLLIFAYAWRCGLLLGLPGLLLLPRRRQHHGLGVVLAPFVRDKFVDERRDPLVRMIGVVFRDPLVVLQVGLKPLTTTELLEKDAHLIAITKVSDAMSDHLIPLILKDPKVGITWILKVH